MADLSDWTPENMAESVTEQATGPADELAKIDEFLVSVIKMSFIFCELASDAGDSYSICMLLANLTIFNIPGYFSHCSKLALDVGSDGRWGV